PDGALVDGDPRAGLFRLGAPHVRRRDGALAARADDGHLDGDRRADGDQGLLLVSDALGRAHPFRDADAVRTRLRLDVRDRRALRDLSRGRPDRHPHLAHLLRGRSHLLRTLRRLAVHDLRRDLLLVPEDDWPDVQRGARQTALLADVHRLQPDLLPDALPRDPGHAAPRRRLRAAFCRPEPVHLDRVLRARRLDGGLPLQNDHELALWSEGARQPVALDDARVAGELAAADLQLRRDPAGGRHPVRVRRAGRAARGLQRRPRPGRGGGARVSGEERHVLVIANETVAGRSLIEAIERRRKDGPVRVTVVTPVNQPREGYVVYEDTRRARGCAPA